MKKVKMIKKRVKVSKFPVLTSPGHCQGGGGW